MPSAKSDSMFPIVRKGYDPAEVDRHLTELHQEAADAQERLATQERESRAAAERAEQLQEILDVQQLKIAELESSLQEANSHLEMAREQEDAIRMMLHEAGKTRDAMLLEAEEQLEAARTAARAEAEQITAQAAARANEIIDEAQREFASLQASAHAEQQAFETDAERKRTEIEAQQRDAVDKLLTMDSLYEDLQATLKLVATRTIDELGEARQALRWLDPPSPAPAPPPPPAADDVSGSVGTAAVPADRPMGPMTDATSAVAEPPSPAPAVEPTMPAVDESPALDTRAEEETDRPPTEFTAAEAMPAYSPNRDQASSIDDESTAPGGPTSDARVHDAADAAAADLEHVPMELPSEESDGGADGEIDSEHESEAHAPDSPIRESTRFTETKLPRLGEAAAKEARDTARSAFTN